MRASERQLPKVAELSTTPRLLQANFSNQEFTWWFPAGTDSYILPISAGVVVDTKKSEQMRWLKTTSPWSLIELPVLGARYGAQTLVVILPSPHGVELVVSDRVGIRFTRPKLPKPALSCRILALRRGADPLEPALAFRQWRQSTTDRGEIPPPRPLTKKIADLKRAERLLGAPHIYLWGPALFSQHDVPASKWPAFAKAIQAAPSEGFAGKLVHSFTQEERAGLSELAQSQWATAHLRSSIARAIDKALTRRNLIPHPADVTQADVVRLNRQALARQFSGYVNPIDSWGDGLSKTLLNELHSAGIDRAMLVLSDLYGKAPRPDAAQHAEKLGYLLGPYDEYHSVHSPTAPPDKTWETSQFDAAAYEKGRVINADGSGHVGFQGEGFHFAPQAAWPYMQRRVNDILKQTPYQAWFMDCDATGECFEDFSPYHPTSLIKDTQLRRQRLAWLEKTHKVVVGSEGGSALFADTIHFGHGVQTPYIGHLHPALKDPKSPYFLGKYWPPDQPAQFFKPAPVPPALKTPYFDPTMRIPLYQAALGDEVIPTHHWSFDSLKLSDVAQIRELMEILYMVPPLYHLSREIWPQRQARILRHYQFWSPLHRVLAAAPLTRFEYLSTDRLVQRTTFRSPKGDVAITVNFSKELRLGMPPYSAKITGALTLGQTVYKVQP